MQAPRGPTVHGLRLPSRSPVVPFRFPFHALSPTFAVLDRGCCMHQGALGMASPAGACVPGCYICMLMYRHVYSMHMPARVTHAFRTW